MRRMILVLLMAEGLWGLDFRLKWALDDGILWYTTVIRGADADHDGRSELIFVSESLMAISIYELNGDTFEFMGIIDTMVSFWEVGDLDGDGLTDLISQRSIGGGNESDMLIMESREYYGYPDTVVWEGYLWGSECGEGPLWVYDFDGDGKVEIMNSAMRYIYVWENEGDNEYEFVYGDTLGDTIVCLTGGAYGDFDGDGRAEMAFSDIYGHVIVMESVGDNDYEVVWTGLLSDYVGGIEIHNVYDNFSVGDMDGDGKMEFVLHGAYWNDDVFVFEAVGDNEYDVVWYDSLPHRVWGSYDAISDVGDVDGDGVPEVVLSTTSDIYVLKAVGDDSLEVVWHCDMAAMGGVPVSAMFELDVEVYDLDGNGLEEIVGSMTYEDEMHFLHGRTFIFEKGIDMCWVRPGGYDTLYVDSVYRLEWWVGDSVAVESSYVYLESVGGGRDEVCVVGVGDMSYEWEVPDSLGWYRLLLVVEGPGRRDSVYSSSIYIGRVGVGEGEGVSAGDTFGLRVRYRELTMGRVLVEYFVPCEGEVVLEVYDVSGRRVRELWRGDAVRGEHRMEWDGRDGEGRLLSSGVYFVSLEGMGMRAVRKVVLVR